MMFFAFFSLINCIIIFIVGLFIYQANKNKMLNRIFFILCIAFSYWAFTEFMYRQAESTGTASLWFRIGGLWPFAPAVLLHFSLVFSERTKFLKKKLTYFLIYATASIFSYLDLTTNLISGEPVKQYWGYSLGLPENTWVFWLSAIFAFGMGLLGIAFCAKYYAKTSKKRKVQAKYVTVGLSIPLFLAFISEAIFVALRIEIPELTVNSSIFSSIIIGYAIWRFQLFDIDVGSAAENIISIIPDSLILIDAERKILAVNKALINVLGYEENELIGKSADMLFTEEHLSSKIFEITCRNGELKNYETKFKTKSSEEIDVILSASIIRNKHDQINGIVAVAHDITEKKQMEKRVLRSEKLAVLGQAATMVGHDLRNPLQSIQNANYCIQIQLKKLSETNPILEKSLRMTHVVDDAIEYADNIVMDLKDFASEKKPECTMVNINNLVEDSLNLCQIPQNVEIIKELAKVPLLEVDERMIKRVFVNILTNGIQAMPDGGMFKVLMQEANGFVEVCFEDTGFGIPKETMKNLFTPFFTTKAQGMGMGLAICKKYVECNGGIINVESEESKGSKFIVKLPIQKK